MLLEAVFASLLSSCNQDVRERSTGKETLFFPLCPCFVEFFFLLDEKDAII
jgi:hypothetical protein